MRVSSEWGTRDTNRETAMTRHDEAVARAERHGWARSTLFGGRTTFGTTLVRVSSLGRHALTVGRVTGDVSGLGPQRAAAKLAAVHPDEAADW